MFIEDLILENDKRGIADLKQLLPNHFCIDAAELILTKPGTVLITTGFYILNAKSPETDGPPGALAIGNALKRLGYDVHFVTDHQTLELMQHLCSKDVNLIEFPITSYEKSISFSKDIIAKLEPELLISIERCAPDGNGVYRNMRDLDISDNTAKIDLLFELHDNTIGIGDGGNEIGMGNIRTGIVNSNTLVSYPVITTTNQLIISSVSNWGGLGLVAALSLKSGHNLLPSESDHSDAIKTIVDLGAVDGVSGIRDYLVDGFSIPENLVVLRKLNDYVNSNI